MRKIACLGAMIVVASVASAGTREIAHRPNYDLAMNIRAENPFTNTYGGTWSYMYTDSLTGERSLMDVPYLVSGLSGIAHYPGNVQNGVPWFHVNRTGVNIVNTSLTGGKYSPFYPLEMDMHPGYNNVYVVLRFTCPRTATYCAPFEFQNVCWVDGKVRCFVLVNGVTKFDTTLDRSQRDAEGYVHAAYDLPSQNLNAGDTIEVVMHNVDGPSCDATVVRTAIYETVDDSLVNDASEAFAEVCGRGPHSNNTDVFTNANNVAWHFYTIHRDDRHARSVTPIHWDAQSNVVHYVRIASNELQIVGASRTDGGFGGYYPYLMVNTNNVAYRDSDASGYNDVLPGELMFHPNTSRTQWGIPAASFRPAKAGFYDLRVNARSLNNNSGDGVEVAIYRDGDILGRARIGHAQASLSGSLCLTNVFLFAREHIDVAIDPLDSMNCDGIALRFTAWKVREGLPDGVLSANAAMYANVTGASPANPYTDADGAEWCFGRISGNPIGNFLPHQTYRTCNNDIFRGWSYTTGSARPYVFMNTEDRMMPVVGNFSPYGGTEGIGDIVPHQLVIHPGNNNVFNVVRFTAPADGIYDVRSFFRHLNTQTDGINAGITVRNQNFADWASQIVWRNNSRIIGSMNPESLYLKEGDEVGFVIGPGPSGNYSCDLSSLEAFVTRSAEPEPRIIGIDFDSGDTATFAGVGRIGWAGGVWNGVKLSDGAAACKSRELFLADGSTRTGVTVEIAPDAGHNLACFAGTSGNALLDDGVAGNSSTNICTFTIGGLLPDEPYTLHLYATQKAKFSIGGVDAAADRYWFSRTACDHAQAKVVADSTGRIVGTFRSYAEGQGVGFNGLQIAGAAFGQYIPRMTLIIFR